MIKKFQAAQDSPRDCGPTSDRSVAREASDIDTVRWTADASCTFQEAELQALRRVRDWAKRRWEESQVYIYFLCACHIDAEIEDLTRTATSEASEDRRSK